MSAISLWYSERYIHLAVNYMFHALHHYVKHLLNINTLKLVILLKADDFPRTMYLLREIYAYHVCETGS
jgi:hypothetical protein